MTSTNLHRSLAPISSAAWEDLADEVTATFRRTVAGRRVVDMPEPHGVAFSSLPTGHIETLGSEDSVALPGAAAVRVRRRETLPVIELRVPFTVRREDVDSVLRGAVDADWHSAKDAATAIARAEDRTLFYGHAEAGLAGIVPESTNAPIAMPADIRAFPQAVAQATSALRLVGVDGPYVLALPAAIHTDVAETADHGYPILDHVQRILRDGRIVWAPALDAPVLLSDRGGDYELHLGQDLSIGYLRHDDETVDLYLEESLTVRVATAEASVAIGG
ncbi:family 1 encapsulin nanocompartment shell protein [Brachybacterium huguangmaarense]